MVAGLTSQPEQILQNFNDNLYLVF
jgi:hypothetical protein